MDRRLLENNAEDWRIETGYDIGFCHGTPIVDFIRLVRVLFHAIIDIH